MCSGRYVMHIEQEFKFNNTKEKPWQRLLTAIGKKMEVWNGKNFSSAYNAPTTFRNLQKMSLTGSVALFW